MNNIKVLLVEDHTMTRMGLTLVLEKAEGIELVAEAEDGLSGVEMANRFAPDVILMDVIMPIMDGSTTLEKINTLKLAPNSIKIILSNKGQKEDIDHGESLGISGYIIKANSTPGEVIEQVKKILENKIAK